ncbi:MAG: hypothetical protein QY871_00485 [Dehalococcoides mccartyi]|uniref:hypothetical protein n=1 Tax=Dehalococcoides mccartyi TaxID=61435 RepID=UPI0025CAC486|nr:hypothetical protein [Dehalococcoides mccartyi]MDN4185544.1 hypothetical protein [Dehalococcoides mccartyi]
MTYLPEVLEGGIDRKYKELGFRLEEDDHCVCVYFKDKLVDRFTIFVTPTVLKNSCEDYH